MSLMPVVLSTGWIKYWIYSANENWRTDCSLYGIQRGGGLAVDLWDWKRPFASPVPFPDIIGSSHDFFHKLNQVLSYSSWLCFWKTLWIKNRIAPSVFNSIVHQFITKPVWWSIRGNWRVCLKYFAVFMYYWKHCWKTATMMYLR